MLFDIDFDVSVDQVTPVNLSLEAIREVEQFIYHEARLLDERRWQAWLDDNPLSSRNKRKRN